MENAEVMRQAADYINIPVLRSYYETIVKEIEINNKYLPEYNQNVIELQNILHIKAV